MCERTCSSFCRWQLSGVGCLLLLGNPSPPGPLSVHTLTNSMVPHKSQPPHVLPLGFPPFMEQSCCLVRKKTKKPKNAQVSLSFVRGEVFHESAPERRSHIGNMIWKSAVGCRKSVACFQASSLDSHSPSKAGFCLLLCLATLLDFRDLQVSNLARPS